MDNRSIGNRQSEKTIDNFKSAIGISQWTIGNGDIAD